MILWRPGVHDSDLRMLMGMLVMLMTPRPSLTLSGTEHGLQLLSLKLSQSPLQEKVGQCLYLSSKGRQTYSLCLHCFAVKEPQDPGGHGANDEGGQGDGHRNLHRDLNQGVAGLKNKSQNTQVNIVAKDKNMNKTYLGGEVCVPGLPRGPGRHLLLDDGLPVSLLQGVPGHGDDVQGAPDGDLLEAGLLVLVLSGAVQLRVNAPKDGHHCHHHCHHYHDHYR